MLFLQLLFGSILTYLNLRWFGFGTATVHEKPEGLVVLLPPSALHLTTLLAVKALRALPAHGCATTAAY